MVDITQPTVLGCAITPWLITLCLCIVGTIVFTVLVFFCLSKRGTRERQMIENAVKNTSDIPVKSIEIPTMDFGFDGREGTEAIISVETETAGTFETEGFCNETEGFDDKTDGFELKTEGLAFDSQTEHFDVGRTEAFEEFCQIGEMPQKKSKFCSRCGNRVEGKFCSHCGHPINR